MQYANSQVALARNLATNDVAEIEANTIVPCMLRKANEDLYLGLRAAGANVERIGDCLAPREVDDAGSEGFRAGLLYAESARDAARVATRALT